MWNVYKNPYRIFGILVYTRCMIISKHDKTLLTIPWIKQISCFTENSASKAATTETKSTMCRNRIRRGRRRRRKEEAIECRKVCNEI